MGKGIAYRASSLRDALEAAEGCALGAGGSSRVVAGCADALGGVAGVGYKVVGEVAACAAEEAAADEAAWEGAVAGGAEVHRVEAITTGAAASGSGQQEIGRVIAGVTGRAISAARAARYRVTACRTDRPVRIFPNHTVQTLILITAETVCAVCCRTGHTPSVGQVRILPKAAASRAELTLLARRIPRICVVTDAHTTRQR